MCNVYVTVFDQTLHYSVHYTNAFSDLDLDPEDDCLLDQHQISEGEVESDFPSEAFLVLPKSQVCGSSKKYAR